MNIIQSVLSAIQNAIQFAREPRHAATVAFIVLAALAWPFLVSGVMRGHPSAEIGTVVLGGIAAAIAAIFWAAKTFEVPAVPYWFLTTVTVVGSLILGSLLGDVLKMHGYETLAASALLVGFGFANAKL